MLSQRHCSQLQSTAQRQEVPASQGAQSQPLPEASQLQAPAGSVQVQVAFVVAASVDEVMVCSRFGCDGRIGIVAWMHLNVGADCRSQSMIQ
jgi:hypothetical protein